MKYTTLGQTNIKVSRLCFGTMSFGGDADEEMSDRMFRRCREAGVNFFDSANMYSGGRAEEILGRLIRDGRDELVITSKVGMSKDDEGTLEREEMDGDFDGHFDWVDHYQSGERVMSEQDTDNDGQMNEVSYNEKGNRITMRMKAPWAE